ncbi:MAG: rhodanese-like domain-containing protein [Lentisphaerae bacterium]|nr:rhodanese-like domain-containing protein [Lentisphaerota bacterium]
MNERPRLSRIPTCAALLLLAATLATFPGCAGADTNSWKHIAGQVRSQFPSVRNISTRQLARMLNARRKKTVVLLDVRQPEEFAVSHLRGARRAVTGKEALAVLSDVAKETRIVAYCSVGYRSAQLAQTLHAAGYTNIVNLQGSIFKWANEGRPVYRGNTKVKTVHPYDLVWGQLLKRALWARPDKE